MKNWVFLLGMITLSISIIIFGVLLSQAIERAGLVWIVRFLILQSCCVAHFLPFPKEIDGAISVIYIDWTIS